MLLMTAPLASPARADIIHRLSTSTALTVDSAASAATRLGSTYSVSGNNISQTTTTANGTTTTDQLGGLTAISAGVTANGSTTYNATNAAPQRAGSYVITDQGEAFSFTESFTLGDPTDIDGTAVTTDVYSTTAAADANDYGVIESLPAFGAVTTTAGGQAASLAGTITSQGKITLTAGGAGTTATGQFVSEVTVR